MSPIRMPFDISNAKNPRVSDMRGDSPLDVLDPHAGADGRLAPVFVGDRRRQLYLVPTRIEGVDDRSEEHTSELQSHSDIVCRLLLEKKKQKQRTTEPIPS